MYDSISIKIILLFVICLYLIYKIEISIEIDGIVSFELLFDIDIAVHGWLSGYILIIGIVVLLHRWYKNRAKTLLIINHLSLCIYLVLIIFFFLKLMPFDLIKYHIYLYRNELLIWMKVNTKLLVCYIMEVWLFKLLCSVIIIVFLFSPL